MFVLPDVRLKLVTTGLLIQSQPRRWKDTTDAPSNGVDDFFVAF